MLLSQTCCHVLCYLFQSEICLVRCQRTFTPSVLLNACHLRFVVCPALDGSQLGSPAPVYKSSPFVLCSCLFSLPVCVLSTFLPQFSSHRVNAIAFLP